MIFFYVTTFQLYVLKLKTLWWRRSSSAQIYSCAGLKLKARSCLMSQIQLFWAEWRQVTLCSRSNRAGAIPLGFSIKFFFKITCKVFDKTKQECSALVFITVLCAASLPLVESSRSQRVLCANHFLYNWPNKNLLGRFFDWIINHDRYLVFVLTCKFLKTTLRLSLLICLNFFFNLKKLYLRFLSCSIIRARVRSRFSSPSYSLCCKKVSPRYTP